MSQILLTDVRKKFLEYFKKNNHEIIEKFTSYISQQKLAHIILNTDIYSVVYKEINQFFAFRYQLPHKFLI